MEVGGRAWEIYIYIYIYRLHCHHQNDSCIKMGSDMRAVLIFQQEVMDKVTRQCPQTTTVLKRKESRSGIEPRFFRLPT